mgnify:CR=1 FL=1
MHFYSKILKSNICKKLYLHDLSRALKIQTMYVNFCFTKKHLEIKMNITGCKRN